MSNERYLQMDDPFVDAVLDLMSENKVKPIENLRHRIKLLRDEYRGIDEDTSINAFKILSS